MAILFAAGPACTGVRADSAKSGRPGGLLEYQVIVKFRDSGFDPSAPAYLRRLANETGAPIEYRRKMSGDAHVFRVELGGDGENLRAVMDRIAAQPGVEWVEQDRRLRHQLR